MLNCIFYLATFGLSGSPEENLNQANNELTSDVFLWTIHQEKSELKLGGQSKKSETGISLKFSDELDDSTSLSFNINSHHEGWNFTPENLSSESISSLNNGHGPWENISNFSTSVSLNTSKNKWHFFGGPIFKFASENGAKFSKSLQYGGQIGAFFAPNNTFFFGGGAGILRGLEKTKYYPIFILKYNLNENWKLQTIQHLRTNSVELFHQNTSGDSIGIGFGLNSNQFRLSKKHIDSKFLNNGSGEYSAMPIYIRARWNLGSRIFLESSFGTLTNNNLIVRDSRGSKIHDERIKNSIFGSIQLNISF